MPFSIAFISENGMAVDIGGYGTRPKTDFWAETLGTRDIRRASAALNKSAIGTRLKKRLEAYVGLEIARNFADGKDSAGKRWEPLSPLTIKRKTKIGASATRTVFRTPTDEGGFTKERKRLDDVINIEYGNAAQSKLVVPLVETGDLFKSVTTAVTRTQGSAATASRVKGGSAIGLVVSERHNVVNFQPSPKGKNWDKKFAVHNRPAGEKTITGRGSSVPGREFFYVSEDAQKFTALLIAMARLVGKDVAKPGDKFPLEKQAPTTTKTMTHHQRGTGASIEREIAKGGGPVPTPFAAGTGSLSPRTISRTGARASDTGANALFAAIGGIKAPTGASRAYASKLTSKGGRRRGRSGNVKFTLADFNHWAKVGSAKVANRLGLKIDGAPGVTIGEWLDFRTLSLLNDAKILGFMKAVDAVSAARAVGKKNREKANASLNQIV